MLRDKISCGPGHPGTSDPPASPADTGVVDLWILGYVYAKEHWAGTPALRGSVTEDTEKSGEIIGDYCLLCLVSTSERMWGADGSAHDCACGQWDGWWPSFTKLWASFVLSDRWAKKRWETEEDEGLASGLQCFHAAHLPSCVGGSNSFDEPVLSSIWGDLLCHQTPPYMCPTRALLISKDKNRKRGKERIPCLVWDMCLYCKSPNQTAQPCFLLA